MKSIHMLKSYNVHHKILNTKDHGIPHSRPRLYIICIRKDVDAKSFAFPEAIPCSSIEKFLDQPKKSLAVEPSAKGARTRMIAATRRLEREGRSPRTTPWIVDIDSTISRMGWKYGCSPCITARRPMGHWITSRGRYMLKTEMMRLKGMFSSAARQSTRALDLCIFLEISNF